MTMGCSDALKFMAFPSADTIFHVYTHDALSFYGQIDGSDDGHGVCEGFDRFNCYLHVERIINGLCSVKAFPQFTAPNVILYIL